MNDPSDEKITTEQTTTVKIPPPRYTKPPRTMQCGAAISVDHMERFVESFQKSSQRWEIVVYPALFAFTLLAGYGFFLIYNLTSDMSIMAHSMDENMGEHMSEMTDSIGNLAKQVRIMSVTIYEISEKLNPLPDMSRHISKMDQSVQNMRDSTESMSKKLDVMSPMSQNIGEMNVSMKAMKESVQTITANTSDMSKELETMTPMLRYIENMETSIAHMNQSVHILAVSVDQMRLEITTMNQSVSRPMSFFNSYAPW
jgi:methyl-accepting chemotaxis protein